MDFHYEANNKPKAEISEDGPAILPGMRGLFSMHMIKIKQRHQVLHMAADDLESEGEKGRCGLADKRARVADNKKKRLAFV